VDGIVWVLLAAGMGMAFSLTWAVYRTLTTDNEDTRFEETLDIIRSSELSELDDPEGFDHLGGDGEKKGWSWSSWWYDAAVQAGRVPDDAGSPGRFALGAGIIGSVFGFLVFPGGVVGIVMGPLLLLVARAWLTYEQGKRRAAMEAQMPLLLSALRSQMHAGVTVQAALMGAADDLPSPLGDEVRTVKRDVNVSIPLDQALDALAQRVPSRQMQFLVASIGIAVKSGADMVPQLITIEEIAQQRARIEGKIKSAVALAKPTAYLAAGAPAIMAAFFFLTDPSYVSYFFGPGLLALLIAGGLYGAVYTRCGS